jgi:hypothetical protein
MGREIRMVPANWEHPTYVHEMTGQTRLQPMLKETWAEAVAEWKAEYAKWEAGERPTYFDADDHARGYEYWEYNSAPPSEREMYTPWEPSEATWYQLWETVSEGTPVSPPFATKEELADYLAKNGDHWDQKRAKDPSAAKLFGIDPSNPGWGIEAANRFVMGSGWAPSMVMHGVKLEEGKFAF